MRPVSLLIKPAAGCCNLRCEYCFYRSLSSSLSDGGEIMKPEIMRTMIDRVFDEDPSAASFAFQGGEPTLAGLGYFRAFTDYVRSVNKKEVPINYAIQTNGILIDDEWAVFLKENRFLVGLSLDGTRDIHDSMRKDPEDKGSHSRVIKTAALLKKHKVDFNILSVLSARLARHPFAVYDFYKKNGFQYLQFIPCLDPFGPAPDISYAPDARLLADFYIKLFDLWYKDLMADRYISIRWFDNLFRMARGESPEQCGCMGFCPGQLVVEGSGNVYPCDFYVSDEFLLGNVAEMPLSEMMKSANAVRFIEASREPYSECPECEYKYLCRGGCRRDRQNEIGGTIGKNRFCGAYKAFFAHIWPYIPSIMKKIENW